MDLIYIDVDGVVADDRHRVHFVTEESAPQWDPYFGAMWADAVWPEGRALYERTLLLPDTEVRFLTGRRIDTVSLTRRWLEVNGFGYIPLEMKPFGLNGKLAEFKLDRMLEQLRGGFDRVLLYDDDPRVVDTINGDPEALISATLCSWNIKPDIMVYRQTA